MKLSEFFASASALYLLAGCSVGARDTSETGQPDVPAGRTAPEAGPVQDALLIRGNMSAIFPMPDSRDCQPLGFPLTFFVGGAFSMDALVDETATPISDTECLHEQTLAFSADSWAAVAYGVLCSGGGSARLCGAQATRLCSVDLMLQWADDRTEPVVASDAIFGFNYVMPPLDKASRNAFYRRTLQEVRSLMAESEAVLSEGTARTQDCPNEDLQEIAAKYAESFGLYQQISERLS
jgi:hypothetical protein